MTFRWHLDTNEKPAFASGVSFFYFFYFDARGLHYLGDIMHYSCTVHTRFTGPTTTLFRKKLKIGPTVLFTHLKIILLQYF